MLKIYGRRGASNVQKVLWCCDEMGLSYEQIDRGGSFGGTREPGFLAMNPNAVVPVVDDDGFVLWESNVIVRYLAAKHSAGRLYPTDLATRADGERWMDWVATTVAPALIPIFVGWIRTPAAKRDLAALEAARKLGEDVLRIADAALAKRDYLGGATFTMSDIPLAVWAYRWFAMPMERTDLPHLRRHYESMTQRAAYQRNVMLPLG